MPNIYINESLKTFPRSPEPFSKCSSEHVNCSFDNHASNISMEIYENIPYCPKMIKKNFCKKFYLMHMFFLAWKRQFWQPFLKWFNGKTKKSYLEVRKNIKIKIFCKNILLIGHLETNCAHMTTVLQLFRRKSENFSPKGGICFKRPTMFSSKCSSEHVNCSFDNHASNISMEI